VVLLFSGLSFAGYLARRAVGAARGYAVTGLLGGVVSSTAVGGAAVVITLFRPPSRPPDHPAEARSPLGLWSAIKMAVGFQVVLLFVPFVEKFWGTLVVGALANTLFKLGVALIIGSASFRRRADAGLAGVAAACGLGLWIAR
jgi:uncharacterized membrane protein (DUF4010 family)